MEGFSFSIFILKVTNFYVYGLCCSYMEFDGDDSDPSVPLHSSSHTSDGSSFMSTSEGSYNSDQGSGNEDAPDANYVVYEESSDEIDFLAV